MVYKVGKGRGPWHTNRKTQGTSTTSLISVGAKVASIGHSYIAAGGGAGSTTASNPQIWTHTRGTIAQLCAINPTFRQDTRMAFNLSSIAATVTGTVNIGDTGTQASTGFTGIVISKSANRVVMSNCTGQFSTAAITFTSGGSTGTATTVDTQSVIGYNQGLIGDMILPLAGYPGASSRVSNLSALTDKPDIVEVDTLVNSILNGRTGAQAVTDLQTLVTSLQSALPNAIIVLWNCAGFTSGSGFNSPSNRQAIADCNTGLASAVPGWTSYGTKLFLLDQFSMALLSPTNLTTDSAAFAAGTTYPDQTNFYYDTLHPAQRWVYKKASALNTLLTPKVIAGDWFATAYVGSGNSITSPTATFSGTAGAVSGTSVSKAIGSSSVGANPLAQVPTGITVAGPSSASTLKCWTEDHPTISGARVLGLEYTNAGVSDTIIISYNTITGGVAVNGTTPWAQAYAQVWHDASGVISGMTSTLAVLSNQKSQSLVTDAITTAPTVSKRLPQVALLRTLLTPLYHFDGTQNANVKFSITFSSESTSTGTQVIKIYPGAWVGAVTTPNF
jgi:hypothetical protein